MNDYLLSFGGYDWLWKDDKDEAYDDFMSKNPSLDHYEAKLKTFSTTEVEIGERKLDALLSPHSTAEEWLQHFWSDVCKQSFIPGPFRLISRALASRQ